MKSKKGSMVKESKDGEVQKLKNRIKRLEKKCRDLVSKLNATEQVLRENMKFLKGSVEDVSLEDLIEAAKVKKPLKKIKQERTCPKCGESEGFSSIPSKVGIVEVCFCGYRGVR